MTTPGRRGPRIGQLPARSANPPRSWARDEDANYGVTDAQAARKKSNARMLAALRDEAKRVPPPPRKRTRRVEVASTLDRVDA